MRPLASADVVEHSRLDQQHEVVCLTMGGLFPRDSAVHELLSRTADGYKPRVLDIGTGSASWAIAIAKAYPNAEVIGMDLAPVIPGSYVPPRPQPTIYRQLRAPVSLVRPRITAVSFKETHTPSSATSVNSMSFTLGRSFKASQTSRPSSRACRMY